MRNLFFFVSLAFGLEASIYSTVPPLIAHYSTLLHLTTTMAGVLTASYTGAVIPGAAIGARISATLGPRNTMVTALFILAASSIWFGLSRALLGLLLARLVQGIAGGCLWSAGLGWLQRITSEAQRGRVIGHALGAATIGTLVGSVLGALALAVGSASTFCLVAFWAVSLAVGLLVVRLPPARRHLPSPLLSAYKDRGVRRASALIVVPSLALGLLSAAVPLRLVHLGVSITDIAAVFVVAAILGAVVGPLVGHTADRHPDGRVWLSALALLSSVPLLLVLAWTHTIPLIDVLTGLSVGGLYSAAVVAAGALLTDASDHAGAAAAAPAAWMTALALGETIGAAGGGALAQWSYALPYLVLAVAHLVVPYSLLDVDTPKPA